MAKIKELTAEHLKKKGQAPVVVKPTKKEDPDTIMSGDSDAEESKEEKKSAPAKNTNGKREKLEYKSKNTLSKSKLANKRTQKEALKKNKMKRNKGTVKDAESENEVSAAEEASD